MKKLNVVILTLSVLLVLACKKDKKETQVEETTTETVEENETNVVTQGNTPNKIKVELAAKSGSNVTGNAVFVEKDGVVSMTAVFGGLSQGMHAIHIHEKADCTADDGTSSGGHWNPTGQKHGKWGAEDGYHKGDIGNFTASAAGNGTITFSTDEWCIGCGDPAKDIVGKAVIVHQGVDDFTSQPTGAAGGRVSCGGIIQ